MRTLSCGIWDLVPWPGIEPWPPVMGAWSFSHWTTREPQMYLFVDSLSPQLEFSFMRADSFSGSVSSCPTPTTNPWHLGECLAFNRWAIKWVRCWMSHEIVVKNKKISVKCFTAHLAYERASVRISYLYCGQYLPHGDAKVMIEVMVSPISLPLAGFSWYGPQVTIEIATTPRGMCRWCSISPRVNLAHGVKTCI